MSVCHLQCYDTIIATRWRMRSSHNNSKVNNTGTYASLPQDKCHKYSDFLHARELMSR